MKASSKKISPKAVIMAGGQGERFWPMTHAGFPKYRIPLYGKKSLLQKTWDRLNHFYGSKNVFIITTAEHAAFIREELPKLPKNQILIEPFRKNTAPAIYFANQLLADQFGENAVVSFYPADHLIENEELFQKTMREAIHIAEHEHKLVTIGVIPTFPSTGYGYIEKGKPMKTGKACFEVKRFVEKPNAQKAKNYIRTGRFFWNAGVFTWRLGIFMQEMKEHASQIVNTLDFSKPAQSYRLLPSISIDRALFEKTKNIALCLTSMNWCDVGNWDTYHLKNKKDAQDNYTYGLLTNTESTGTLVLNHCKTPIMAFGLKDLVIIQTEQGTLVCPRGRAEEAVLRFHSKKI